MRYSSLSKWPSDDEKGIFKTGWWFTSTVGSVGKKKAGEGD